LLVLLDDVHEDIPMFSTGSGRPVSVKKSSLQKATTVLDGHDGECFFTTGSISEN
jgi:BRCA2 repeat